MRQRRVNMQRNADLYHLSVNLSLLLIHADHFHHVP
jgi:hypothetical protein